MTERVNVRGLEVAKCLHELVERHIAPGTGIDPAQFWEGFASIVWDLGPKNHELLDERDAFQVRIDEWYEARAGAPVNVAEQEAFLREIGYLAPEGECYAVSPPGRRPRPRPGPGGPPG